jgi:hypothetical protein
MNENVVPMFEISSLQGHLENYEQIAQFIKDYHWSTDKKESNIILNNTCWDIPEPYDSSVEEGLIKILDAIELNIGEPVMTQKIWYQYLLPGQSIFPHIHGSDIQGKDYLTSTLWLDVPAGSGDFVFWPVGRVELSMFVKEPKNGDFIVHPSGLLTGVLENKSDKPRISLSMDITPS